MTALKRAALYARVSTSDRGQDTEIQLHELRQYAAVRGWQAFEYVDNGVSGTKETRPALDSLLLAARQRRVDAVVVWKLDRLGRSLSHLLQLLNEFEVLGVTFVSLRESIDLSTPTGRLMAYLLGAFAEFERALIRERVVAGIEAAKRKGIRLGRKPMEEALREKVIDALKGNPGISVRALSAATGVSRSTAHRIVQEYHQKRKWNEGEIGPG